VRGGTDFSQPTMCVMARWVEEVEAFQKNVNSQLPVYFSPTYKEQVAVLSMMCRGQLLGSSCFDVLG
jgi:hypothetical protein